MQIRGWLRAIRRRVVREERGGLTTLEMVLIAALVVIVSIVAWRNLGTAVASRLNCLAETISSSQADRCSVER